MNVRASATSRPTILLAAIAALALSMMYLIRPVLANDLHQTPPISWDASNFSDSECDALKLAPGEVFWHFVQNQVADGTDTGKMTVTFDIDGTSTVDSYKKSGGVLHWSIITGHDTLLAASTDVTSDGQFNLSHICVGPPEQSVAESARESVAQSVEQSVAESVQESVAQSVEQSVEQSVAESVQESVAQSVEQSVEQSVAESAQESVAQSVEQSVAESAQESVAQSVEQSVAESQAESVSESVGQSAEQSVEAGTGTPSESQPNTAMGSGGSNPLPTIAFGLILLASLSGLAFVNVKAVRNRN